MSILNIQCSTNTTMIPIHKLYFVVQFLFQQICKMSNHSFEPIVAAICSTKNCATCCSTSSTCALKILLYSQKHWFWATSVCVIHKKFL